MRALIMLPAIVFGACSTASPVPPPASLTKPGPRLMTPPDPLPEVKAGDSLYTANAVCRAEYGALSTRLSGLQNWATVVTRSKK